LPRILIVEDDQHMIRLLKTLFSLDGVDTLATHRPEAVVDMVRQERPDAVVMDLNLGQVKTLDILKTLKSDSNLKSIPIVLVSGMDMEIECKRAGADAFMLKPYSPNALLDNIRKLIKQSQ
jgi:CheY-like chemotaxis protein